MPLLQATIATAIALGGIGILQAKDCPLCARFIVLDSKLGKCLLDKGQNIIKTATKSRNTEHVLMDLNNCVGTDHLDRKRGVLSDLDDQILLTPLFVIRLSDLSCLISKLRNMHPAVDDLDPMTKVDLRSWCKNDK